MTLVQSNLDLICRLCMSTNGKMYGIFNSENNLTEKIRILTAIEMTDLSDLPRSICTLCQSKLIMAIDFRGQCLKTNVLLMKAYSNSFEIKEGISSIISLNIEDLNELPYTQKEEISFNIIDDEFGEPFSAKNDTDEIPNDVEQLEFLNDDNVESTLEIDYLTYEEDEESIKKVTEVNKELKKTTDEKGKPKSNLHKNIKKVVCPVCGEMKTRLEVHMAIHTGEKNFICPHCNKGFGTRGILNNHINIHTGNKPFKCEFCEKAFCDRNSLIVHTISTHKKTRNFQCKICNKNFGYNSVLSKHLKTHSMEKKYSCTYCEKAFNLLEGLKKHTRTHTGERPYACKVCDKRFVSSGNLSSHRKIHSANRPYKCTICKLSFSTEKLQISHMMKFHEDEYLQGEVADNDSEK